MKIFGRMKLALIGIGAAIAALIGVYAKGRGDQRQKNELEDLETYRDTRKRIDQAARDADGADAREWLSERKSGRRL